MTLLRTAIVAVVVLAILAPVHGLYFWADDFEWLREARRAVDRGPFALPANVNGHFRPLVDLIWLLGYRLCGLAPERLHLAALLLHTLCAALVAALGTRVCGSWRGGVAAGLLFGVCFAHRAVPTWISAAPDLWTGLLGALALLLAHSERPRHHTIILITALAGLAKETAVLLPLLLLVTAPGLFAGRRVRIAFALLGTVLLACHLGAVRYSPYLQGRFTPGSQWLTRLFEAASALLLPVAAGEPGEWRWWLLGVSGWLLLLGMAALAGRSIGSRAATGWLLASLLALSPALLSRSALESRWLYLPWVALAPLAASALLTLADLLGRRQGTRFGSGALALALAVHLVAHGTAMRAKIARDVERERWSRVLVEGVARGAPALADGDVVEVRVPFGSELRFWPVGVQLMVGAEVEVRPIDDRSAATPGIALYDATTSPPRWSR